MKIVDIALVGDAITGRMEMHRADCPAARKAAAEGAPVVTLLGCDSLPRDLPTHSCMGDDRATRHGARP